MLTCQELDGGYAPSDIEDLSSEPTYVYQTHAPTKPTINDVDFENILNSL